MAEGDEGKTETPAPPHSGADQRPRRGHQRIVFLGLAALGAAGFFFLQRQGARQSRPPGQPPAAPPSVPVATAAARTGNLGVYVNALGYVTPLFTVTVRTRVDGQLLNVNFREGDMVR